jgi:ubiquinone/menaquinone biosynthesis C-methylase UbiE
MVSFFDNMTPPVLRDQWWFMRPFFKIVCGKSADSYMNFKQIYHSYSLDEIEKLYQESSGIHSGRDTDLNEKCISEILAAALGECVLDIACGKGLLSKLLAEKGFEVTACDFLDVLSPSFSHNKISFIKANICSLNFEDKSFDTVISAHTIEHIEDIFSAVSELRRVARRRLIIVAPKQRACKFTFDFHIHFFPYEVTLLSILGARNRNYSLKLLGGDWLYVEDIV